MIPTGNEFFVLEKIGDNRKVYLSILGNISDLEPDLCDQMRKSLILKSLLKSELHKKFFLLSV